MSQKMVSKLKSTLQRPCPTCLNLTVQTKDGWVCPKHGIVFKP